MGFYRCNVPVFHKTKADSKTHHNTIFYLYIIVRALSEMEIGCYQKNKQKTAKNNFSHLNITLPPPSGHTELLLLLI